MVEVKYLCPRTWSLLSPTAQAQLQQGYVPAADLRECLRHLSPEPAWLPDLAAVELANGRLRAQQPVPVLTASSERLELNPSLEVVEVAWRGLLAVLDGALLAPEQGIEHLLFWRHPRSGRFHCDIAAAADLLALKIIVERHDPRAVAASTAQPVAVVDRAVEKAVARGLVLAPPSRLVRTADTFFVPAGTPARYLSSPAFTLQWHITQSCDLHCRHCYDRSEQEDIALEQGVRLLDQMRDFCLQRHVFGQISFSGGNPFLHPDFFSLYRAAVDRNLVVAVLGNPVGEEMLRQLLAIAPPAFYQVSLEGLKEHNDDIRGHGNFAAVVNFLDMLRRHQVPSRVMLTLTEKNMEEVLPLAEFLRDKADLFTYNRLSMVGEGAALQSALGGDYQAFIRAYVAAKKHNPIIAQKDNLINIERDNQGLELFGGCTGYGCGAAFNFVAIVPNGDVHACRKYPSPIGNIHQDSLADIYDSERARAYREGPSECAGCHLRPVCGGCPAVTYGCGLEPLTRRDPACFVERA